MYIHVYICMTERQREKREREKKRNLKANTQLTRNFRTKKSWKTLHTTERKLEADTELMSNFFASAKEHLDDDSAEIHITLRRAQVCFLCYSAY